MVASLCNLAWFLLGQVRWKMHKLAFPLSVFAALFASAEMRTVIGYGTGDTLDQALIMAQSAAVLNAGGTVASTEQVQGDVLVSDKGVSSNVMFVSEYKILEKGESFDGVSARIEAKVCKVSERQFENGKSVTGEGEGPTKRRARLAAIGNAVSSLGVRIKAVGEYDKDVLLKDETEAVGWAYVTEIQDVDCSGKNGKYKSKIKIKVFANKSESGPAKNFSKETAGRGRSFIEAVNNARARAVFDLDSDYVVKTTYNSGEFVSRAIRHDWRGFWYGTEVTSRNQGEHACDVNVRINFDENENSHLADGVSSISGFGLASTRDDAIEDAKRDAVVNAGSVAEASVTCEEGKELVEQLKFRASAYIGLQTADIQPAGEKFSAQIGAKVSRDRGRDSECRLAKSVASDDDRDARRAYLVARFKSFVAAGALYDVERLFRGDGILADTCSITSARANCGFTFDGLFPEKGSEFRSVQVQTHGLEGGAVVGETVFGVGCGKTESASFELAKNDAVVNACSKVAAKGTYDKTELKGFEQLFVGNAFIGGVAVDSAADCSGGRLLRVRASVSGSPDGAKAVRPSRVDYEAKANSADAAIALARRGLLMKSGAMAKVRMKYKGFELVQADAEYGASGVLADCKMQIASDPQKAYSVRASGRIVEGNSDHGESKVEGLGSGPSFQDARRAAIAYAILNWRGEVSAEEKYCMGEFKSGSSQCNANGFLFKSELLQCAQNGDGHFVKVLCTFAKEEGKLSGGRQKVKAVGWGQDEESARIDAERNAVDSVFGRKVTATMAENNGEVTSKHDTEQSFGDGYVEETKVVEVKVENGLHVVKIKTTVRQRGVEEDFSWGWIGWTVLFLVLLGIVASAKEKRGKASATVVWLIVTTALFSTGHWIMGVLMVVFGLGLICKDK